MAKAPTPMWRAGCGTTWCAICSTRNLRPSSRFQALIIWGSEGSGHMSIKTGLAICCALGVLVPPVAHCQASRLDAAVYARAEALMGPNLEPKVRNVFVVPHWLGGSDTFWYER